MLKDEDVLSTYKIQSSHTIHMVKGAARSGPSAQPAAPQQLPTMQAGQNPHDPLTQLNGPMGFGLMAGFNPFADMGLNTNDPNMVSPPYYSLFSWWGAGATAQDGRKERGGDGATGRGRECCSRSAQTGLSLPTLTRRGPQMQSMLNSPEFLQQMSSVMSNPAVLDQIIAANPQLSAMGPQVREVFRSERFRQMMSNPDTLRMMLQMSNMMRDAGVAPPGGGAGAGLGMGMGPFGGAGFGGAGAGAGVGGFPAPGLPSTARQQQQQPPQSGTGTGTGTGTGAQAGLPPNPFGFGFNPFMNPWGVPPPASVPSSTGSTTGTGTGATGTDATTGATGTGTGAAPAPPPPGGMFDPAMMQQMMAAFGGGGAGGLAAFGAPPAAPADSRPPEERFQVQLQVRFVFSSYDG